MNKGEFMTRFNERARHRWPAWQVGALMPSDWFAAVGRYDLAMLARAMQRHKVDDDPSRPRRGKVHSVVCSINRPYGRPALGAPGKVIGTRQLWQKVHTSSGRGKRVGLMKRQIKFDPRARDTDHEACARLVHGTSADEPVSASASP